jgi:hypothetical protein
MNDATKFYLETCYCWLWSNHCPLSQYLSHVHFSFLCHFNKITHDAFIMSTAPPKNHQASIKHSTPLCPYLICIFCILFSLFKTSLPSLHLFESVWNYLYYPYSHQHALHPSLWFHNQNGAINIFCTSSTKYTGVSTLQQLKDEVVMKICMFF